MINQLVLTYQKRVREVERISSSPIPIEEKMKMARKDALLDAETQRVKAYVACYDAGLTDAIPSAAEHGRFNPSVVRVPR